jgi:phosphoribosylanthranilate isomerase
MWIKICGITSLQDALAAVDAGADAIGINLVPSSRRVVTLETAAEIAKTLAERVRVVAVVADASVQALGVLRREIGVDWLQLHGTEPPEDLRALLPNAYKAIPIESPDDVARADGYAGDLLLVDTKVPGALGGTGRSFDWTLVSELAKRRRLILAGGLAPDNVARAIAAARPYGVDVASGVELPQDARRKDAERMRAFVQNARRASEEPAA